MSLRRKILFKDAVLLASLMLMIAVALWGLLRQRQHVQASLDEYTALQKVEAAQIHLVAFQQSVHADQLNTPTAVADLQAASLNLRQYKAIVSQYNAILPPEISPDQQQLVKKQTETLVKSLVLLSKQIDPPANAPRPSPDRRVVAAQVDSMSRQLTDLLSACNGFVHQTELASAADLRLAIAGVSAIAGCTLVIALLASFWQYRLVMRPLNALRRWCRQTAAGDFSIPYGPTRDREFLELGRDVNKMAGELAAFHRRLEAMVAAKSRDLVRSERLASVGYLAAGVAHEINNPLNIMSGYAELSLKRLGRLARPAPPPDRDACVGQDQRATEEVSQVSQLQTQSDSDAEVMQHLSIIRSEAFRCKEITQKLLSLAKGNGEQRTRVSLADAITEVAGMVRGLKAMRGKQLCINLPVDEPLHVTANLTEIKQVLLNLLVNAIEAVSPGPGTVTVDARRAGNWIEVDVADNGRGMSAETRERVFEPFFTNKRGSGEPGTGLGLSITHAIIENHRGQIFAFSDGLERGSRFTIRLLADARTEPAAEHVRQTLETVAV
jgi:signal transduction histidine kinase